MFLDTCLIASGPLWLDLLRPAVFHSADAFNCDRDEFSTEVLLVFCFCDVTVNHLYYTLQSSDSGVRLKDRRNLPDLNLNLNLAGEPRIIGCSVQ